MKIRKASKSDANEIAFVLKESYNINSLEEGKEAFLSEINKGVNYIVADENNQIIGLTSWYMHGLPKHGLIELDRIAILPDFRGKGISKQLFQSLITDSKEEFKKKNKELRKLFLLTHASNERAHRFYEKMGLKHETTLKNHYYKDEDECVYSMFF